MRNDPELTVFWEPMSHFHYLCYRVYLLNFFRHIFTFCCWLALRDAIIDVTKVVVISSAASIDERLTLLGLYVKVKRILLCSALSSNFRQFTNFAVIWNVLILLTNLSFSLKVYSWLLYICVVIFIPPGEWCKSR